MVVKEDGTKWACQSCLKGHRVSGCNHTDRELTLVPKKGRPVTQCQHCRLERKKRSAHVKCDCGEGEKPPHPKEKCIHLREAEERAKAGFFDDGHHKDEDASHLSAVAEEQGCCCGHGGKCSCSLIKKESQTDGTTPHGPAVQKPRLESTRSDGQITVFANGHHKPVHKRNHAAQECGMPYKMPLPRVHGDPNLAPQARRSVDSLALDTQSAMFWNTNAPSQHPRANIPSERRLSKSEQPSPRQSATGNSVGGPSDAKLSGVDFSALGPVQTNQSVESGMSDSANMFPLFDPMSGIADSSFDPWSAFPSADSVSMPNNNPFGVWATTFDHGNAPQPALTAASSGTQSEIDEVPTMDDLYGLHMPSIQEDAGAFSVDSSAGDNPNRRSLPPNFFGNTDFSLPVMADEWQAPMGIADSSHNSKAKPNGHEQSFGGPAAWNTPTMPSMTSIAQRGTPATSNPGRPTSHSVGPGSAPNEDVIRQLFPDIDVAQGLFGSANSPTSMDATAMKKTGGLSGASSSTLLDTLGPMDESVGFNSQPWSDGSMSIPNDAFNSPYNLDQDFSNQEFWSTAQFQ